MIERHDDDQAANYGIARSFRFRRNPSLRDLAKSSAILQAVNAHVLLPFLLPPPCPENRPPLSSVSPPRRRAQPVAAVLTACACY